MKIKRAHYDTVDGELATERNVLVPKLGLQPELALGPSSRLKEVDLEYHRLVLECSWATVGILQPSRDYGSIVAGFDQRTRCSGESPSTTT